MDKKGNVGKIIMAAFGAIILIVLFVAISQETTPNLSTSEAINVTVTAPAANATLALTGRELIGTMTLLNGSQLSNGNFTIGSQIIDDDLTVFIETEEAGFVGTLVNVSYAYEPDGYFDSAGTRGAARILLILAVIAIAIFVLNTTDLVNILDRK